MKKRSHPYLPLLYWQKFLGVTKPHTHTPLICERVERERGEKGKSDLRARPRYKVFPPQVLLLGLVYRFVHADVAPCVAAAHAHQDCLCRFTVRHTMGRYPSVQTATLQ